MALEQAEAARIMAHMNNDHPESLAHYVQHFGCVKGAIEKPKITTFNSSSMVIHYGKHASRRFVHLFEPEMAAGQARKRLEEMHSAAKQGLGYSKVTVNRFDLGMTTNIVLATATAIQLAIIFAAPTTIAKYVPWGGRYTAPVLERLGVFATTSSVGTATKVLLIAPLHAAHLLEIILVLIPLLRRYNVTSTAVRLQYYLATLIAGFPIWSRLKAIATAEERLLSKKA